MTEPSGSTQAPTVLKSLNGLRDTAQSLASGYLGLVNDVDRAIEAITWGVDTGKLTQFPSVYSQELDQARARLQAGGFAISSAQSAIQLTVSGSTSLTIKGATIQVALPLAGAPPFRRAEAETELDQRLTQLWGSAQLSERRRAAWPTLALGGPESSAQAAHTTRELLTDILDRFSPNAKVRGAPWWSPDLQAPEGVSKRQKIRYFLVCGGQGVLADSLLHELDQQVQRAIDAHRDAIDLAHHRSTASGDAAKAAIVDLEEVILTLLRYRQSLGQCP